MNTGGTSCALIPPSPIKSTVKTLCHKLLCSVPAAMSHRLYRKTRHGNCESCLRTNRTQRQVCNRRPSRAALSNRLDSNESAKLNAAHSPVQGLIPAQHVLPIVLW